MSLRKKNRLSQLVIDEVSLVDSPADPEAQVLLYKRADDAPVDEIDIDVEKGQPTSTAVVGGNKKGPMISIRGKNKKRDDDDDEEDDDEMMKRRTLGALVESGIHQSFTNLADNLYRDGHVTREERIGLSNAIGDALSTFVGAVEESLPQLYMRGPYEQADGLEKSDSNGSDERRVEGSHPVEVSKQTEDKMAESMTLDLSSLPDEVREAVETQIDSLTKRAENAEAEVQVLKAGEPEGDEGDILKNADPAIRKMVEDANAKAAEAEAIAKAERDARLNREFLAKAESLPFVPGEDKAKADVLKSAAALLPDEQYQELEKMLSSMNEMLSKSEFLKTAGNGVASEDSATGRLEALAKSRANEKGVSYEKALDEVLSENPDLYAESMKEGNS